MHSVLTPLLLLLLPLENVMSFSVLCAVLFTLHGVSW